MRLRTLFFISGCALGLIGLLTAATMVATTTLLSEAAIRLGRAAESVRGADELELSLVLHEQALTRHEVHGGEHGPARIGQLRAEVAKWLARVAEDVGSDEERALVDRVHREVEAYLAASAAQRPARLREAIASSEALSLLNIRQARETSAQADQAHRAADTAALLVAISVLVAFATLIVVARRALYRPLLTLRAGISAFGHGDHSRRVDEIGPVELRQIAAEFNSMAQALDSQNEAQLRFVAGVAHDLRSPLNALKLSAALAIREASQPSEARVRQLVERMASQTDRLTRMVADLLDRSRIEAGALELRLEECDLREVAAEVVELHRASAEAHQLELVAPTEPIRVRCDPTRVSQVLTNLVNNAIKYSPEGGTIRVRLEAIAGVAQISVTDPGLGIPADQLEGIFEPFRRSDGERGELPGIGLGLSVSRRIARAHGGEIRVESTPGEGSTFRVVLPRPAAEAVRAPQQEQEQRPLGAAPSRA